MLSGPFSTVEELVVECHLCQGVRFGRDHHIQWGGFFNYVGQVKTVQLPFETAHEVTHSFQQGSLLDFLPSLEQVNVGFKHLPPRKGRYVLRSVGRSVRRGRWGVCPECRQEVEGICRAITKQVQRSDAGIEVDVMHTWNECTE
jgi:hypothetical protein